MSRFERMPQAAVGQADSCWPPSKPVQVYTRRDRQKYTRPLLYPFQLGTASSKSCITTTILRFSGFCLGLPGWVGTRKVKPKPVWISWSKRQWVAVGSAGPYADLHLAPVNNHASTPPLCTPSCISSSHIASEPNTEMELCSYGCVCDGGCWRLTCDSWSTTTWTMTAEDC